MTDRKPVKEHKALNRTRPEKQGILVSTHLKEIFDNIRADKAEELKRRISVDEIFEMILNKYNEQE